MKKLPKSIRKYIRKEKARIRRQILDIPGQNRQIAELLEKLKTRYNKNNQGSPLATCHLPLGLTRMTNDG